MKKSVIVHCDVDIDNPRPLTPEDRARLERIAAMPDEDIDFSDIPPLTEAMWERRLTRDEFLAQMKRMRVPLDPDVEAWLRAGGDDVETKLNAVLRRAMHEEVTGGKG